MRCEVIGSCALYLGDMREIVPRIQGVHACATDPPYHLQSIVKRFGAKDAAPAISDGPTGVYRRASAGFMGQQWDGGDISFRPETWDLVMAALCPGAHLAAFTGTRTYHRIAVAIEDAGFEIRDMLGWVYGTGFPKSHDVSKAIDKAAGVEREVVGSKFGLPGYRQGPTGVNDVYGHGLANGDAKCAITAPVTDAAKQWQGWGTALKPSIEPIVFARKSLDGTVAETVLEHGTGALNIDACRVGDSKDVPASPRRAAQGPAYGDLSKSSGETSDFNPDIGRWPANLITDGSMEVYASFPHGAREAMRFFYAAKASKAEREAGLDELPKGYGGTETFDPRNRDGIGEARRPAGRANTHPTVKPIALMQWLVRLITPPGGLVLDPFMGSGSTGIACVNEGFRFIGIEQDETFFDIACRRIEAAVREFETGLFPVEEMSLK